MLGETQLTWLKSELLSASSNHPLIFIGTASTWHGSDSTLSEDWSRYTTERTEIANFIAENNITGVCFLSGNGGILASHDGSRDESKPELNLPEFHVGPIDLRHIKYQGTWTQVPVIPSDVGEFFGLIEVTDNVTSITVTFTGLNQYAQKQLESTFTIPVSAL